MGNYKLEFWTDENGRQPALEWMQTDLTRAQRRVLGEAISRQLEVHGVGVCRNEYGKQLGDGLFEFRVRGKAIGDPSPTSAVDRTQEQVLLRVFCHAYGSRIVLVLGGYDKGKDPNQRRQQREIKTARSRLTNFKGRSRDDDLAR